jgi:hypothetical protein
MMRGANLLLLAGLAALTLSGCGTSDSTRTFGTSRDGSGDVSVASRPPLSVPPVLAQRPPRPGAPRIDETAADSGLDSRQGVVSPGQDALVESAGPSAPANIRQRIDQDAQIRRQNQAFTDELLFGPPGERQSAGAEAPMIQQGGKSWLGSIF